MKTVSRAYDTYGQARAAVAAVEAAGVPYTEVSLVANKYVSAQYADVDDVNKTAAGAGIGGAVGGGAGLLAGIGLPAWDPSWRRAGWRRPLWVWPQVPLPVALSVHWWERANLRSMPMSTPSPSAAAAPS